MMRGFKQLATARPFRAFRVGNRCSSVFWAASFVAHQCTRMQGVSPAQGHTPREKNSGKDSARADKPCCA